MKQAIKAGAARAGRAVASGAARVHSYAWSSQGSMIVGVLMLAFLVYITLQGHLGQYLADLGFGKKAPAAPAPGGTTATPTSGSLGGLLPGGLPLPGGLSFPQLPGGLSLPSLPQLPTPSPIIWN